MKIRIEQKTWFNFLLVYLILLFRYGFMFVENYSRFTMIILLAMSCLACVINCKKNANRTVVYIALFMMLSFFITYIFKGFPDSGVIVISVANIIIAILVSMSIEKEEFYKHFSNIMFCIAVFSIVGWILMMFFHSTIIPLPSLVNSAGRVGYYVVFTIISDFSNAGMQRCQGIFWEPGALQALIIVAMFVDKYNIHSDNRDFRKYVYSIAILMSFSTTGYVALMLFWALELFETKRVFGYILAITAGLLLFVSISPSVLAYIDYTLFQKFWAIFEYNPGTTSVASARVDSIVFPIKQLLDNPLNLLVGNGVKGANEMYHLTGHYMSTCTPLNLFAKFGVFTGMVSFFGIKRLVDLCSLKHIVRLFILIILMVTFSSESFDFSVLLYIFMFYGYSSGRKKVNYEDC